jgi:hypothetical protein
LQAPNVPTVAEAMKKARAIVQYFNKSTQATKKLKDMQHESSLPKYSGQPKNILQDVVTRWWSTYRMLKKLRFQREAISHYFVDNPNEADTMTLQPKSGGFITRLKLPSRRWASGSVFLREKSMSPVP